MTVEDRCPAEDSPHHSPGRCPLCLRDEATWLREENAALALRLERDAFTYATMQKGMESQAELADGLKQKCRMLEAEVARLREDNAALADGLRRSEDA